MAFRILVPFLACALFFFEPTFSLFSPLEFKGEAYVLVPHFFAVFLILLAGYDSKKIAMLYGVVFGILYDVYHIDMIGIYMFIYPFIAYIAALFMKQVQRYYVIVLLLVVVSLTIIELLSFGFASVIGFTSMTFKQFAQFRLMPTVLGNLFFTLLFGQSIRWFILKRKQALEPAM